MADENETAHYGLDKEFITTAKILMIYHKFYNRSITHLIEKRYEEPVIKYIRLRRFLFYFEVIKKCLKIDIIGLLKK